jgi:hypothetical protein
VTTGFQVTFDCDDAESLAKFWASALGYVLQPPPEGHETWESFLAEIGMPEDKWDSASALIDPEGKLPRLFFQKVPEQKSAKNRVHLDINVSRDVPDSDKREKVDSETARLTELGATVVEAGREENGEYWVVMNDPEGNEFCIQ